MRAPPCLQLFLLCTLVASFAGKIARCEESECDVAVYGATPAGIAAALASSAQGKRVLLIEPTARLGGLTTSGLSHTDFHSREGLSGAFANFASRVEAYYVKTYGADSEQARACFGGTFGEPKINLMIFQQMLAEHASIHVRLRTVLQTVACIETGGNRQRVESATCIDSTGKTLHVRAKVFIDASYEGDLMAAAGVPFHVGRESRETYGESLAPEQEDQQLQAYNFRFIATDEPSNRVPIAAPKGYRREDFLGVLPLLAQGSIERVFGYPSKCVVKAQTPALPNQKYDINDVSKGLVRLSMPGVNQAWPTGDATTRQRIFDEHLRYNVGLLYFLQNDPEVPAKFREPAKAYGWCRDEFIETDHLPPQLYVREARRMKGEHIYIQQDSEHTPHDARAKLHPDAIAMGEYGNNCHGTAHEGPIFGGQHTGEFYNPVPPYQVPYGVLVPKTHENLLVPVAASSSHVGFCALRLEPIWMSLGQAAGHAAVIAIEDSMPVQALNIAKLQSRLHDDLSATIYVSDIPLKSEHFKAVQWWGTAGGLHGLEPAPKKPGQRGKNLHGQYFEANPGHEVQLNHVIDDACRERWIQIAASMGIRDASLSDQQTRGDFIALAYKIYLRQFPLSRSQGN